MQAALRLHSARLLTLLTLLISNAWALLIRQEQSNNSSLMNQLQPSAQLLNQSLYLISSPHCTPGLFRRRAKYSNCEDAIAALPNSHRRDLFHNDGADDGYQLPVTKTVNSCKVAILLRTSTNYRYEWDLIVAIAFMLNEQCLKSKLSLYVGGYVGIGDHDQIIVSLSHPDFLEGGGNLTVAR